MYSTLSYLTRKANFKQVNPDFPITQTIPDCEPADVFECASPPLLSPAEPPPPRTPPALLTSIPSTKKTPS